MTQFRVMLAATLKGDDDLQQLKYPLIGSPKVDGIRCYIHPELGPVTRKLKPIPNGHIHWKLLNPALRGLDGEIVVGPITAPNVFNRTTSAVMAQDGTPDFTFWAFDYTYPKGCTSLEPYFLRLEAVKKVKGPAFVRVLPHFDISHMQHLVAFENACLSDGYEGIMLRSPNSPYKYNRSTLKEQYLLKLKRFADDEAVIVGFEALERNNNAAKINALGLQERSSHKNGKVADNILGNLLVEHPTFGQFSIGSGFDDALRNRIWFNQKTYLGKKLTFKYQASGIVDKPRFPIFKGFGPKL